MAVVGTNSVRLHIFRIFHLKELLVNVTLILLLHCLRDGEVFVFLTGLVVDLPEQSPAASTLRLWVVDVDVVILAMSRLLNKRLRQPLSVNHQRVILIFHMDILRRFLASTATIICAHESDACELLQALRDVWRLHRRTTVSIDFDSGRCRNAKLIQYLQTQATIPQNGLHRNIIHAERFPQLRICDCLVQRKAIAEEADQEVAHGPILHTLIQDDLVTKHDDLKVIVVPDYSIQDVA